MKPLLLIFVACIVILSSCGPLKETPSVSTSHPPDAEEVLRLEPEADILQWDGDIFMADVEWVQDLELTEKDQIGDIIGNTKQADDFKMGQLLFCQ